ncbi:serine/threonine-protein kinase [Streptomyces sp. NPDC005209]|uniref:serine/threonine-protein kinase n=1 Tax=Streptomyces sp. NPDC005209 TaxID=3156715 RepID=UPI0033A78F67
MEGFGWNLGQVIGRGGMGVVHAAVDRESGEPRAVKVVDVPQGEWADRALSLFEREAGISRTLLHPHVVRTYDVVRTDEKCLLVMELCSGGSVAELIRRVGVLPPGTAVRLALEILAALEYAHRVQLGEAVGLVHRDMKPQNVLLVPGDVSPHAAKIADFGLAKAFETAGLSGLTQTGSAAGTPSFMCREQVLDYKYAGPAVDVWSAAATLYFMLTGYSPRHFPAGRDPWLIVCEEAPVPVAARNPAVPTKLADLIDRALDDGGELVFTSAADLTAALRELGTALSY